MDSFSLQCFLMLADKLNFTRVAYSMNVSQPTLSRIIANLEREVGATLFNRSKQAITLTTAGQQLVFYAESIIQEWETAIRRTQLADKEGGSRLRIGFLPAMCMELLPTVVQRVKNEHAEIELVLEPHSVDKLIAEFNDGNLDLILMMNWKTEWLNNCMVEQFYRDNYCVALHKDHPLANREFIQMEEIVDELCLFYKTLGDFRTHKAAEPGVLALQFEMAYKTPLHSTKTVGDLLGLMTLLECREGIGILPSHLKRFGFSNIKFIPILSNDGDGDFTFRGMTCWRQDNCDPAVDEVRRILREVGSFTEQ